jgi:hypothetical protein
MTETLSERAASARRQARSPSWKPPAAKARRRCPGLHEPDEQQAPDDPADEYDEEQEIAAARQQNTRTIEIERFLPAGQIDARYFGASPFTYEGED